MTDDIQLIGGYAQHVPAGIEHAKRLWACEL
jgi:hypothetical protein